MSSAADKSDYEVLVSPDNREYYYNKKTRESSFAKPDVLKGTDEEFDVDPWIECRSSKGKRFYHNTVTRESRWDRPVQTRKGGGTRIGGIGTSLRITDHGTSKYLIGRLMEQDNITSVKEALYRLATEPIFRAIDEDSRCRLVREYLEEKERSSSATAMQRQGYYREEICKLDVDVSNFFEFNNVFCKHPYYTKIDDKFGCYEAYMERHGRDTDAMKIGRILKKIGVGLDTSAVDVLGLKELEQFDRRTILLCFSRYFRSLGTRYMGEMEQREADAVSDIPHLRRAFTDLLSDLYRRGLVYYKMKFKDAFHLFKDSGPFLRLLGSGESPKELYFEFVNDMETRLRKYEGRHLDPGIDAVDRRAMQRYLGSTAGEKEEGEI